MQIIKVDFPSVNIFSAKENHIRQEEINRHKRRSQNYSRNGKRLDKIDILTPQPEQEDGKKMINYKMSNYKNR